jgi:hypothetical protein
MIVVNGGAHDNEIIDDSGRGSHVIPAGIVLENVAETNYAVFAEVGARRTAGSIDSNKTSVLRGLEDAAMAGLVFGAGGVKPGGNATINEPVAVVAIEINLRIVGPALVSGFRVKSDDAVEGGGEVERAVH